MPTYLVHGFRWGRPSIRIHIILNGLDDAAAEWLMAPRTTTAFKRNFTTMFPDSMKALPNLRFIEQYDPNDETGCITDYAYVADFVHEVKLDADIEEIRGQGVPEEQWIGILGLRDNLAPLQKVAWYIVVCGDEERSYPKVVEIKKASGVKTIGAGSVKGAVNSGRPASRASHAKDEEKSEATDKSDKADKAEKAKRSNSFTRSIRKIFTPKESKDPKDPKDPKEKEDRGREIKKSRSMRSIRSFTNLRNRDPFRSERNSPDRIPPLPGTAK